MIVAINTIFFAKENELDFLKKVFNSIITAHPEHTFLLIGTEETGLPPAPNVQFIHPGFPPAKINRWFFWMYFKLKQILKNHQPDILINNGDALFHVKKVPQLVFNPDLRFIYDPKSISAGLKRFYDLFAPSYYQKVKGIIFFSDSEKNFFKNKFRVNEQKLNVIQYGAPEKIKPVGYEEREGIKETYAKGYEYFLYAGLISQQGHLINLLKSFSAFKKRQRSSMQLLIMGPKGLQFDTFQKTLNLYKYKNDVHLMTDIDKVQSQRVISSAYAIIFPYRFDKRSHLLLSAIKYEVPCLVADGASLSETGKDAVLHFEPDNIPDLAGKMMHLFKDEKARKKLIENGKVWKDENSFEIAVNETWETLKKITSK